VKTSKGYTLTIENIGGMAAPVNAVVTYTDGTTEKFHQSPAIWEKSQKQATVNITTKKEVASIKLDGGIFMDADPSNNSSALKAF
jgi:hypothetical protein